MEFKTRHWRKERYGTGHEVVSESLYPFLTTGRHLLKSRRRPNSRIPTLSAALQLSVPQIPASCLFRSTNPGSMTPSCASALKQRSVPTARAFPVHNDGVATKIDCASRPIASHKPQLVHLRAQI